MCVCLLLAITNSSQRTKPRLSELTAVYQFLNVRTVLDAMPDQSWVPA